MNEKRNEKRSQITSPLPQNQKNGNHLGKIMQLETPKDFFLFCNQGLKKRSIIYLRKKKKKHYSFSLK